MTTSTMEVRPRRGRTAVALISGFMVGLILSLGTDQILHVLKVYPPWGQTMSDGLFALASAYRIVFTILGAYVAARLAPDRPMWHAMVLGVIGFVISLIGAAVTWNAQPPVGPHWYALAVAAISLVCAWIGGKLRETQLRNT
jgi:peptidoglycan/LPS O-acetylase OafA/YrhL